MLCLSAFSIWNRPLLRRSPKGRTKTLCSDVRGSLSMKMYDGETLLRPDHRISTTVNPSSIDLAGKVCQNPLTEAPYIPQFAA